MHMEMQRLKTIGQALDVTEIGTPILPYGWYELRAFQEGKDYFDGKRERWIWSIGRRLSDGKIIASLWADLYGNPEFECLWLR